jgi:hypothetical protein
MAPTVSGGAGVGDKVFDTSTLRSATATSTTSSSGGGGGGGSAQEEGVLGSGWANHLILQALTLP